MIKTNKILSQNKKGFTLIEVMVSVSLFVVVMTLSLGAIMSIIDGNKKAQAVNNVANNLNYSVESIVRDIKTGYAYTCQIDGANNPIVPESASSNIILTNSCGSIIAPRHSIALVSTITGSKRGVIYYLDSATINGTTTGVIYKATNLGGTISAPSPVTSPEVNITKLDFYVDNPNSSEYTGQPRIFLIIKGTATINPTPASDFTIQTLISQRNLNLPK
jgi:prepilin-type N-terminal cleavage/methylation domain-containing protein